MRVTEVVLARNRLGVVCRMYPNDAERIAKARAELEAAKVRVALAGSGLPAERLVALAAEQDPRRPDELWSIGAAGSDEEQLDLMARMVEAVLDAAGLRGAARAAAVEAAVLAVQP